TGISVDDLLASSLNHRKEISKVFEVQVPRKQLVQGHQVTVGLRFEDQQGNEVGAGQSFSIELQTRSDVEALLHSVKFHILGKRPYTSGRWTACNHRQLQRPEGARETVITFRPVLSAPHCTEKVLETREARG